MTTEERIARLERNVRIGPEATPGGEAVTEVRARQLTLVDENGKARAWLGIWERV